MAKYPVKYQGPYTPQIYENLSWTPPDSNVTYAYERDVTPEPPTSTVIRTSNPARKEVNTNISNLNEALGGLRQGLQPQKDIDVNTYNDPYTRLLDEMSRRSNVSTQALIGTIKAQRYKRENEARASFDDYRKGLQLLGIQSNQAQATPELLAGQQTAIENQKMAKLEELDAEEKKALMEAEDARFSKDFELLKERMNYVDKIKKERQNALKELYDTMRTEQGIAEIQAGEIYDTLNTLNEADKEAFLIEVSKRFNVPLNTLVRAIAVEKENRAEEAYKISQRNKEKKETLDKFYTVISGDEPQFIADKLGLTKEALISLNPGVNWYNLKPGQKLNIDTSKLQSSDDKTQKVSLTPTQFTNLIGWLQNEGAPQWIVDGVRNGDEDIILTAKRLMEENQ